MRWHPIPEQRLSRSTSESENVAQALMDIVTPAHGRGLVAAMLSSSTESQTQNGHANLHLAEKIAVVSAEYAQVEANTATIQNVLSRIPVDLDITMYVSSEKTLVACGGYGDIFRGWLSRQIADGTVESVVVAIKSIRSSLQGDEAFLKVIPDHFKTTVPLTSS